MITTSPSTTLQLDPAATPPLLAAVERQMAALISNQLAGVSDASNSASHAGAYHLAVGGQRVRARLALHASSALALTASDAVSLAATAELLHNASLIHDDIQDGDEFRRGQPAVWTRYGVNTAVCAGDLLLSAAYASLCHVSNSSVLPALMALVHARTCVAVDGQCADLSSRENPITNTSTTVASAGNSAALARYQAIAVAKSGALLSLPIEMVLLLSENTDFLRDARIAAEAFSVAYQIHDDLNDLENDTKPDGIADTLNIIHLFRSSQSVSSSDSESPESSAIRLAMTQLDATEQHAATLPAGSGGLLIHYSTQLRKALLSSC